MGTADAAFEALGPRPQAAGLEVGLQAIENRGRRSQIAAVSLRSDPIIPPGCEAEAVRLDLWLWAARFFKTRALARQAIERGQVRVDGQPLKPSRAVRVGLALHIERAGERYEIEVRGLADQRGPASVAQQLYAESAASVAARLAEREKRRFEAQGYQPPETRPNKRQRRLIQALGDLDAL